MDLEELEEQIMTAKQELEKLKLQDQDARSARNIEQQNRQNTRNRAAEDYNAAVDKGNADVNVLRYCRKRSKRKRPPMLSPHFLYFLLWKKAQPDTQTWPAPPLPQAPPFLLPIPPLHFGSGRQSHVPGWN